MDVVPEHSIAAESEGKLSPSTVNVGNSIEMTAGTINLGNRQNERPCSSPHRPKLSCVLPKTPQTRSGRDINTSFEDEGYHTGVMPKVVLPLTPSPTPRIGHKRAASYSSDSEATRLTDRNTKRRLFGNMICDSEKEPKPLFYNIPSFSVLSTPARLVKLSETEMQRVAESILEQVDWDEVADYVASNRGAQVYKRAFKEVMQSKVDELEEGFVDHGMLP
ncbi:MAG: hypothetical protein M1836_006486 [Candelina mexicana]|nr:MAG: hypothetical protein M1836_006486 [Candelina mexicana]